MTSQTISFDLNTGREPAPIEFSITPSPTRSIRATVNLPAFDRRGEGLTAVHHNMTPRATGRMVERWLNRPAKVGPIDGAKMTIEGV